MKDADIQLKHSRKTYWDWLQLLVVPLTLLVIGSVFTYIQNATSLAVSKAQHETDTNIANDQQKEAALNTYINDMSDLLLNKNLGDTQTATLSAINTVARIKTLTVLHRLDPGRKRSVMKFLSEADLIQRTRLGVAQDTTYLTRVQLNTADLTGVNLAHTNFSGSNLVEVNLEGADLTDADFDGAALVSANLSDAKLGSIDLIDASLAGANLEGATLAKADLEGAGFSGANLDHTNLKGAGLGGADLSFASLKSADLRGAHLPGANVKEADLKSADIRDIDLRNTDITSVRNLETAKYDFSTVFTAEQVEEFSFLKGKVTTKQKGK